METKLKILTTAYAVHPTKGSEDGMGWNYVKQIARYNNVYCVTRENNQTAIEEFMRMNPDPIHERMNFIYFDLPYWQRFWKPKGKGALVYFWMWQRSIPKLIRRLNLSFDITHNLNFHNDWTPSYLWKLGKPFVWGPIGHHPMVPVQYLKTDSIIGRVTNRLTWWVKTLFWKHSRALKNTVDAADFIYAMNSSVGQHIALKSKDHIVQPSVASQDYGWNPVTDEGFFTILSAGRLVSLKGFDLTLRSFTQFVQRLSPVERARCTLKIVGKGPEKHKLERIIRENSMQDFVEIVPWMPRASLLNEMKKASVFLYPSHEGAGMVVPEALSFGLPVVCLDNYGPGEMVDSDCAIAISHQGYDATVSALSTALYEIFNDPVRHQEMRRHARKKFETVFDWNTRGDWLSRVYRQMTLKTLQQ